MYDSYYGIGYVRVFPRTPDTATPETMFLNYCFVEVIIYFVLLAGSILSAYFLKDGQVIAHLVHNTRVIYILMMSFYFIKHAIDSWAYDWNLPESESRDFFW